MVEVRARVGGGEDELGVVREVELESLIGEGPDADVAEALVELDERVGVAGWRVAGCEEVGGAVSLLAEGLGHVFGELVPEVEHAAFLVVVVIGHRAEFFGDAGLADVDGEVLWWDEGAGKALFAAVLEESDGGSVAGNYLVALGVGRGVSSAEVIFGVGYHDACRGSLFGAIKDAADAAVSEYIADAEFVGVVNPFDDVRTTFDTPKL